MFLEAHVTHKTAGSSVGGGEAFAPPELKNSDFCTQFLLFYFAPPQEVGQSFAPPGKTEMTSLLIGQTHEII